MKVGLGFHQIIRIPYVIMSRIGRRHRIWRYRLSSAPLQIICIASMPSTRIRAHRKSIGPETGGDGRGRKCSCMFQLSRRRRQRQWRAIPVDCGRAVRVHDRTIARIPGTREIRAAEAGHDDGRCCCARRTADRTGRRLSVRDRAVTVRQRACSVTTY
jgi:hypothetical protein